MSEKLPRIARADFRELRKLAKEREKISEELQKWKEDTCDRDDVNCYADQLAEFSGKITRDDARYNAAGFLVEGTIDRLPKGLVKEARKYRLRMTESAKKLVDFLDKLSEKYDTYPDLIDPSKGTIAEHTKAAPKTEEEAVSLKEE